MSLRRAPANAGKTDHTSEILKTIEHAKLAHDSFMRSNPGISAVMSDAQKQAEVDSPFNLKLSQVFINEQTQMVEVSVTLSDGIFSRLNEMSMAVSDLFAPIFASAGFTTLDPGTLNKVCSNPSTSFTLWKFSKSIDAIDAATRQAMSAAAAAGGYYFVLPSGGGNALQFLLESFRVTPSNYNQDNNKFIATVGDNNYLFEPGAFELGRSVSFRLIPQ